LQLAKNMTGCNKCDIDDLWMGLNNALASYSTSCEYQYQMTSAEGLPFTELEKS
jgi:hypothetical protein